MVIDTASTVLFRRMQSLCVSSGKGRSDLQLAHLDRPCSLVTWYLWFFLIGFGRFSFSCSNIILHELSSHKILLLSVQMINYVAQPWSPRPLIPVMLLPTWDIFSFPQLGPSFTHPCQYQYHLCQTAKHCLLQRFLHFMLYPQLRCPFPSAQDTYK